MCFVRNLGILADLDGLAKGHLILVGINFEHFYEAVGLDSAVFLSGGAEVPEDSFERLLGGLPPVDGVDQRRAGVYGNRVVVFQVIEPTRGLSDAVGVAILLVLEGGGDQAVQ